jgi:alpha-tubulin suppressor-like RCC1 family protein
MGTRATAIASGGNSGYALTSTGSVLAWGDNHFRELGNGGQVSCARHNQCDLPVRVELPKHTRVTAISGGGYHALALTSSGSVLAWGENQNGQLGNASTSTRGIPVRVKLPTNTKATEIAAGAVHSLALISRGTLLAWGSNADGELGNGNISDRDAPVNVKLPRGAAATAVAAGCAAYFSLAVVP